MCKREGGGVTYRMGLVQAGPPRSELDLPVGDVRVRDSAHNSDRDFVIQEICQVVVVRCRRQQFPEEGEWV